MFSTGSVRTSQLILPPEAAGADVAAAAEDVVAAADAVVAAGAADDVVAAAAEDVAAGAAEDVAAALVAAAEVAAADVAAEVVVAAPPPQAASSNPTALKDAAPMNFRRVNPRYAIPNGDLSLFTRSHADRFASAHSQVPAPSAPHS